MMLSIILERLNLSLVLYAKKYRRASEVSKINRFISVFQVISLIKLSKFDLNELLTIIK